jgi:hypothetical protein
MEILNTDESLLPIMHLRDNLRHTIPKSEAKVMSGTLGIPWSTCRGLLYDFTRRPPVYGHFCAVPYRRVQEFVATGRHTVRVS